MKKLLTSILFVTIAFSNGALAQNNLVATLEHNDTLSVFYGVDALKSAHDASADGDVITLSSGTFNASNITKAITLRGAGMELDTINHIEPTIISGNFQISANHDTYKVTLEGLYHDGSINLNGLFISHDSYKLYTLRDAIFMKCRLGSIVCNYTTGYYVSDYAYAYMENVQFVNCKITKSAPLSGTASFTNCYVTNLYNHHSSFAVEVDNCVLVYTGGIKPSQSPNSTFRNSYIYLDPNNVDTTKDMYPSSVTLYNNVANDGFIYQNATNDTNKSAELTDVFKTFTGTYTDAESFQLTEAAKTTYLGNDDTQIGMYGGTLSYDPAPSNPRISKFIVTAKPAEGKLEVQLEAK